MSADDMEGRLLADIEAWPFTPEATSTGPRRPQDMAEDLRALLLDYQERGRALTARTHVVPVGRKEIARFIGHAITAYENDPSPDPWTARANACGAGADAILAALGTKGADHDWAKWDGGPNPVGDAEIEVRFKGWPEMIAKSPSILDWKHEGPPETHVIAYRLATDTGREA